MQHVTPANDGTVNTLCVCACVCARMCACVCVLVRAVGGLESSVLLTTFMTCWLPR